MYSGFSAPETISYTDAMEVPYAETFSWPIQGGPSFKDQLNEMQQNPQSNMPGTGNVRGMGAANTTPISSEDIAAFMRINPGQHPFP